MGQYIHQKDENNIHSVGGKIFNNNTIRTSNSCKPIPRYMNLNKELMYLYGWYIAEGSSKSLVMNKNEIDIAKSLEKFGKNIFIMIIIFFRMIIKILLLWSCIHKVS